MSFDKLQNNQIQIHQPDGSGNQTMVVGSAGTLEISGALQINSGSTFGLYGATPAAQPASANQAAIGTIAPDLSGWNGSAAPTSAQATAINAAIAALKTLVNQLRSDMVTLGAIKGSA